jgi:hypothetical protein
MGHSLETIGLYGRSNKDTIIELLDRFRDANAIYMNLDSEEKKKDYMETIGMPDLDYDSYHENIGISAMAEAARETGIDLEVLDFWVAENWQFPDEEKWDKLEEKI